MAEIAVIHGGSIPGEPDQGVVNRLRDLLHQAEIGHVQAIAFITVDRDGSWGSGWECAAGTRHRISSGILDMQHRWVKSLTCDCNG